MTQPFADGSRSHLTCPLCQGTDFTEKTSRTSGSLFGGHLLTMMICSGCSYVLHFYGKRSIFPA